MLSWCLPLLFFISIEKIQGLDKSWFLTNYWSNWSKINLPKSVTCIKYQGTDVKIYVAKRLDRGKWAPFRRIATQWGKIFFGESFNCCFSNWKVAGSTGLQVRKSGKFSKSRLSGYRTFSILDAERLDRRKWAPFRRIATQWGLLIAVFLIGRLKVLLDMTSGSEVWQIFKIWTVFHLGRRTFNTFENRKKKSKIIFSILFFSIFFWDFCFDYLFRLGNFDTKFVFGDLIFWELITFTWYVKCLKVLVWIQASPAGPVQQIWVSSPACQKTHMPSPVAPNTRKLEDISKKIAPPKTISHHFWALQLEKCDTILLRKCTQVQHFWKWLASVSKWQKFGKNH